MDALSESARKLSEASRKSYQNPYSYIDWPEKVDVTKWFVSPELISAYGTPEFDRLDDAERRKLSFYEAVNFFSLNIHGEKPLVEGLARRLYSGEHKEFASYLHHFLDEENKHMIYFAGFCERYAGKIYRDRKLTIPREYEKGEEDFLFFAKVMIFEEIVDQYNVQMSNDARLDLTARNINLIHHLDEARHLVFGRQMVLMLFKKYRNRWSAQTLKSVREYLCDYIVATWKEYYNPDVYADAGLQNPYDLVDSFWEAEASRLRRQEVSSRVVAFLKQHQMIVEEPAL